MQVLIAYIISMKKNWADPYFVYTPTVRMRVAVVALMRPTRWQVLW